MRAATTNARRASDGDGSSRETYRYVDHGANGGQPEQQQHNGSQLVGLRERRFRGQRQRDRQPVRPTGRGPSKGTVPHGGRGRHAVAQELEQQRQVYQSRPVAEQHPRTLQR